MDLMNGRLRRLAESLADVGREAVGAADHRAARIAGVADGVVGEDGPPPDPVLGVEITTVASLEPFDCLDLQQ
jgi:hypothetical protein